MADINDAAAKDIHQFADLAALAARRGFHLEQHQVALDMVLPTDVVDLYNRHDFFELLADLIEHTVVADDDARAGGLGMGRS